MVYLIAGITGLLIIVALFTFLKKEPKGEAEEAVAPDAECCGAHAICEKGLKKASAPVDYFEDEELDAYRHTDAGQYTDAQIEEFRDILYSLRKEEIGDWLISLEKREINLPTVLRQEVVEML